jgi:curved DNA-binding protein
MTDPYKILGVNKNSSDKEIKTAYRKLAKEHHPDTGGDGNKFAEISSAYDSIKDADARAKLNSEQNPFNNQNFHQQRNPFDNFDTMFEQHFGPYHNPFNNRRPHRQANKNIKIQYHVDLKEVFNNELKNLNVQFGNGVYRTVSIRIPKGITHGAEVRYQGYGENIHPGNPGDLFVTFLFKTNNDYIVEEFNLIKRLNISIREAMLGAEKVIETLDGRSLKLNIKPGTQSKTRLRIPESGLPRVNLPNGNLYIEINVQIPVITDTDLNRPLGDVLS